jgi:hypothetical protein
MIVFMLFFQRILFFIGSSGFIDFLRLLAVFFVLCENRLNLLSQFLNIGIELVAEL